MNKIKALKNELLATFLSLLILLLSVYYVSHALPDTSGLRRLANIKVSQQSQPSPSAFFLGSLLGLHEITLENFPLEPVEALANQMALKLQPGITRPIRVVSLYRKEPTPLAAFSKGQSVCTIVLNKNPSGWAQWNYFFSEADPGERMNIVELSIAHEIGHCADIEMARAAGINVKSKSVLSGEVFADIYASIYAKEKMGRRGEVALAVLNEVRAELSGSQPEHATAKYLHLLEARINKATEQDHLDPSEIAKISFELGHSFAI